MATTSDLDVQWYCERDIVAETGMPGPLVAELLPHLPTPPGRYSTTAELYDADSIQLARLVTQMLRVGVRMRFIRMVTAQPMTRDQLAEGVAEWTAIADSRTAHTAPSTPRPPQRQILPVITIALLVLSALLLGVEVGIALGRS